MATFDLGIASKYTSRVRIALRSFFHKTNEEMIKMKIKTGIAVIAGTVMAVWSMASAAADRVQPFILASVAQGDATAVAAETKTKLEDAGFSVVGSYSPYAGATVIAATSDELKAAATQSERGGYGAVVRVGVTKTDMGVEVSYTNPVYWGAAYRMNADLSGVAGKLGAALGKEKEFGTGDKVLTADDMRKYHYTVMMEYFDNPSKLAKYKSHDEAVKAVEAALAAQAGATSKIYRIDLGKDPKGNAMTLYGVGLKGANKDDCSGDEFIMSRIDKADPRSTAHLPYEMLVYGGKVEALYARFRIAASWPYLPMVSSKTGATFLNIMCSPAAIEDALEKGAGKE